MNLFTIFEAHRNPLIRLIDKIERIDRKNSPTLLGRLLCFGAYTAANCLPAVIHCAEIIASLKNRFSRKKSETDSVIRRKDVSAIILNWNGADLLPRCIIHLKRALESVPGNHEIIVVDNNSGDSSISILSNDFPEVRIVRMKGNIGFSRGNNAGVKVAKNDLIMLLNNDIFLHEETFETLLHHFDNPEVFAAAPKVVLEDGTLNEGHSWGEFNDSMLLFHNERQDKRLDIIRRPAVTLYPIGACALMDRRLYLAMGGLDPMLSPFYWEDDDLGYRALKRGYQVIYDPRVSVVHKNAASSVRLPQGYTRCVKEKNMLLFLWKNLSHKPYQRAYLESLKLRVETAVQKRDYTSLAAYLLAFAQAGELILRKSSELAHEIRSDKEVLSLTRRERQATQPRPIKRHVLLVTPFLPFPLNNGGAIRVFTLVKHLSKKYDFSLLSFVDGPPQQPAEELTRLFKHIDLVERKHSPVGSLLSSELPEGYNFYMSVRMEKTLKDILANRNIDIVQIEFPWMAYYGSAVTNHPTIFVEHDVGNMLYGKAFTQPVKGLSGLLAPLRSINYARAFMGSFDRIITVTEKDQLIVENMFPGSSVTTVETGVDLSAFNYAYDGGDGRTLVYLGHYRHYPNEDAAVHFVEDIFPMIKSGCPDVKLHLVGSHPTRRINRYKGRDDIIVTGSVPDVTGYLKKGTVFVAPIRLGGGIKGKLLEALATGLPVVASPVAAAGLGAEDGRDLLLADNPEEFANQVLSLLNDADLRKAISTGGRNLVEQYFDWQKLADKMSSVYQEVTHNGNSGLDRKKPSGDHERSKGAAFIQVANG